MFSVHWRTVRGSRSSNPKITSNTRSPDLWLIQNQLPPNLDQKNTKNTRHNLHKLNLGGQKVVRATFPAAKTSSCTNHMNLWTSLTRTLRGPKQRKENGKMKELREMGPPSSYLIGLLHNPRFALRYFELNHITRGRYGPTQGNLHLTATASRESFAST